jgi:septal ring-binding cell division protein DamX
VGPVVISSGTKSNPETTMKSIMKLPVAAGLVTLGLMTSTLAAPRSKLNNKCHNPDHRPDHSMNSHSGGGQPNTDAGPRSKSR